jgi:hypothetical protein
MPNNSQKHTSYSQTMNKKEHKNLLLESIGPGFEGMVGTPVVRVLSGSGPYELVMSIPCPAMDTVANFAPGL